MVDNVGAACAAKARQEGEDVRAVRSDESAVGFTPGPWRALCLKKYSRVVRDSQGPGDETGSVQICHIAGPQDEGYAGMRPFNKERWDADARLMAAAPDLYEALVQMLLEKIEYMVINKLGDPSEQHTCKMASAALKKARGEA